MFYCKTAHAFSLTTSVRFSKYFRTCSLSAHHTCWVFNSQKHGRSPFKIMLCTCTAEAFFGGVLLFSLYSVTYKKFYNYVSRANPTRFFEKKHLLTRKNQCEMYHFCTKEKIVICALSQILLYILIRYWLFKRNMI